MEQSMAADSSTIMLVTGGSGLVSHHWIDQALTAGYKVRTTTRRDSRKQDVLKGLNNADTPVDASKVKFVITDLLKDKGWAEAVKDVSLVLHVASPFPRVQLKDANELIRPAVDRTLRVLNAARASSTVKRLAVTSSQADDESWTRCQSIQSSDRHNAEFSRKVVIVCNASVEEYHA